MAVAAVGVRTGSGWSGRCGGRAAGGGEQVQPFVLAVPAFGQVQGDVAAAVPGGAGGDGDQVAADGRGPGLRERRRLARAPAARSRLCAMAAIDSQAAFAAKHPGRHVSQGAAGDVGEHLLHDGVVAVLPFGLDQLERENR